MLFLAEDKTLLIILSERSVSVTAGIAREV
jgi:hypothetical protein